MGKFPCLRDCLEQSSLELWPPHREVGAVLGAPELVHLMEMSAAHEAFARIGEWAGTLFAKSCLPVLDDRGYAKLHYQLGELLVAGLGGIQQGGPCGIDMRYCQVTGHFLVEQELEKRLSPRPAGIALINQGGDDAWVKLLS